MLASSVGTSQRRCRTATRAAGHCRCASARMRSSSAPAIASYAEYSIPVTPPSSGPSRTVPRKRQLAPCSGPATSASRAAGEIGSRVRCPPLGCTGLSSRQRRQEGDLVSVPHRRVEPHMPQIHRREGPLGELRRPRNAGPHPAHHFLHRRGGRQGQLEILAPHQLGVAREELESDHCPTVPVARPRQMRAALASGLAAFDRTKLSTPRSTTLPVRVIPFPSRRTTIGSAAPAFPR